jgi:Flp pilus assembly protein TadD
MTAGEAGAREFGWRRHVPVIIALVVAAAYRLVVLAGLRQHPEILEPVLDGAAHLAWARGLLDGTWPGPEPFFRAPGYPFALAGLLAVAGGWKTAAAVQLVAGSITAGLAAALGRRLGGGPAAWIGGLGAALYAPLAFFDFQFLAPVLAVPLFLGATLATLAADERPSAARVVAAALLWAVAVTVRPPLLAGAVVLPALLLLRRRRALAALAVAGVLSLPLVVTARNAAVGDAAFLATQGGLNFYLGNGALADGVAATFPDAPTALGYRMMEAAGALAERETGEPLRATEVSRFWAARARADIAADPVRWIGLLGKKAFLFLCAREIPNNHDPVLAAELVPALRLPGWGLWLPLAGLGVALGFRRRDVRIVTALVAAVALGCVVFFVNARFRVPAAPLLVALGAFGLSEAVRRLRADEGRAVVVPAGVAAVLAVAAWTNPYGLPRDPWPMSYVLVAEAERNRGEPVRSLRWIERALEAEPGLYSARLAQVELLRRMGRLADAEEVVDRMLTVAPDDPALLGEKAILLDLRDRPAEAVEVMDRVLRLDPGNLHARINRAVMLARCGREDEARAELEAVMRDAAGRPEASRAARVLGDL